MPPPPPVTPPCSSAVSGNTRPTGDGHAALTPFDLFPTADGACAVAAPTERHWPTLCELIGRPDMRPR